MALNAVFRRRQDPAEAQDPHLRVRHDRERRRAVQQGLSGFVEQSIDELQGIVRLRENVDGLGDVRRRDAGQKVLLRRKEGTQEVDRLDPHDFVGFFLDEPDPDLRQRLE